LTSLIQRDRILEQLRRDCGPVVTAALADRTVLEINRNADGRVWIDRFGQGMAIAGEMADSAAASMLATVATILQTVVNFDSPILEGELPLDGSRLAAAIPPLVDSPVFSIRRHADQVFRLDDYVGCGALGARAAQRIADAVANRQNIVVVGGTGSGKTTLLNAILHEIASVAPSDRIAVIEDTKELQVASENKIVLRTAKDVTITELLRLCMRLQPNRIVVGEVRGAEAHGLLKAWNSGHPGGCSSLHADSPVLGLRKLVDYVFESPGAAARAEARICAQIAATIHLIVFIEKTGGVPSRRVSDVAELTGYADGEFQLTTVGA
jgi:type IV secretion system protein TrbB